MKPTKTLTLYLLLLLNVNVYAALNSPNTDEAESFRFPFNGAWNVSQEFADPEAGTAGFHTGLDISRTPGNGFAEKNIPIFAIGDGIIRFSQNRVQGLGGVLMIEHLLSTGEKIVSFYGHLRGSSIPKSGYVKKGDRIGYLLNRAYPSFGIQADPEYITEDDGEGRHLHFGIIKGNYEDFNNSHGLTSLGYETWGNVHDYWNDPVEFFRVYVITRDLDRRFSDYQIVVVEASVNVRSSPWGGGEF